MLGSIVTCGNKEDRVPNDLLGLDEETLGRRQNVSLASSNCL